MNKEEFVLECNKLGVIVTEEIYNKLFLYKNLLIEWNKKFNLTTIIEEKDIFLKHFYDSLCIVKAVDINNKKILDFGTGAGFPGMVLAIVYSKSNITLLESNGKKVSFLEEVKKKLELDNVTIICNRAEIYGKNNREIYDIVTCRAVSNLNIILELSSSMLKINGLFIPLKSNVDEELENSKKNFEKLSYDYINKIEYKLPIEESNRTILVFKKVCKTKDIYPRNYNIIKKSSN